jgi:hypothetical protein
MSHPASSSYPSVPGTSTTGALAWSLVIMNGIYNPDGGTHWTLFLSGTV